MATMWGTRRCSCLPTCAAVCSGPPTWSGRWERRRFLALLPATGLERAQTVAQRVHAALAEQPLPGIEPPQQLSVSMGLTLFDPLRPLDVTLRLLDSALYTAKRGSRSRTVAV